MFSLVYADIFFTQVNFLMQTLSYAFVIMYSVLFVCVIRNYIVCYCCLYNLVEFVVSSLYIRTHLFLSLSPLFVLLYNSIKLC